MREKENVIDIEQVVKRVLFHNVELSNLVSTLEAGKQSLEARNFSLEAENATHQKRLSQFEIPQKAGHNSSIPLSKESLQAQAIRRTRSLRTPGGRPPGGQAGHTGSTIQMRDTQDAVEKHIPEFCTKCGLSLSALPEKVS